MTVKYFDPSYIVRSRPANKDDALLCDQFARNAVHAAMAGRTDVVIGIWYNVFVHVPITMATASKRRVLPGGEAWSAVLAATGQPPEFRNSEAQRGDLGTRSRNEKDHVGHSRA